MSLIGKKQGNLVIKSLHHKDVTKYVYPLYYYLCKCLLCKKNVILPSTNIRKYKDCGRHKMAKMIRKVPYKKGFTTISDLAQKSGHSYAYVCTLLNRGITAEAIINETYPKGHSAKKSENSIAAEKMGMSRQTVSWRVNHGWTLKKVGDKYSMEKPYAKNVQARQKEYR